MLSEHSISSIGEHAKQEHPKECCGFVLKDGTYLPLKNVHDIPEHNFSIRNVDYINHHKEIAYVAHSHTNGDPTPSFMDMCMQISSSLPWVIVGTTGEHVTKHIIFGDCIIRKSVIGLNFIHGVNDCYSLIRNWYFLNRNTLLPDFPRSPCWWENQEKSMYLDNFGEAGFVSKKFTSVNDLFPGDIILIRIGKTKTLNHAGVYVGEGGLLAHHMSNKYSMKEPIYKYLDYIERVLSYDQTSDIARRNAEQVRRAILI
jgi:proteasome lid subunit RPN8/RPN11